MKTNSKTIVVAFLALCSLAASHASQFLIKAKQPFVNPDIPSVMIVQELNLSQQQIDQLREAMLKYRMARKDLAPGYENRHRTILQGPQAVEPQMVSLIVRSGREIAAILSAEQQKKVGSLEDRAEAIAATGFPLAFLEIADYSSSKLEKIIAIGKPAAMKLSKLAANAPASARNSIVATAWGKVKDVLSRDEYSQLVDMMHQRSVPVPTG